MQAEVIAIQTAGQLPAMELPPSALPPPPAPPPAELEVLPPAQTPLPTQMQEAASIDDERARQSGLNQGFINPVQALQLEMQAVDREIESVAQRRARVQAVVDRKGSALFYSPRAVEFARELEIKSLSDLELLATRRYVLQHKMSQMLERVDPATFFDAQIPGIQEKASNDRQKETDRLEDLRLGREASTASAERAEGARQAKALADRETRIRKRITREWGLTSDRAIRKAVQTGALADGEALSGEDREQLAIYVQELATIDERTFEAGAQIEIDEEALGEMLSPVAPPESERPTLVQRLLGVFSGDHAGENTPARALDSPAGVIGRRLMGRNSPQVRQPAPVPVPTPTPTPTPEPVLSPEDAELVAQFRQSLSPEQTAAMQGVSDADLLTKLKGGN